MDFLIQFMLTFNGLTFQLDLQYKKTEFTKCHF